LPHADPAPVAESRDVQDLYWEVGAMAWVEIMTALALIQFAVFAALVGKARGTYGVKAPAVSGNEMFERYYRVQMNTLEVLVLFVPGLWLAAGHLDDQWIVLLGAVYLIGRVVYFRAYVTDPAKRGPGFSMSLVPSTILIVAGLVGAVRELLAG
jgi:uncharacterized MAPEG superfamily protein